MKEIIEKIKAYEPKKQYNYLPTAVLVLLMEKDDGLHVIFELRSKGLRTQPGEISFPGGKLEEGESPLEGALRETCEELGIHKEDIELLGALDPVYTSFGLSIYPFAGLIKERDLAHLNINPQEVDHAFSIPVAFFLKQDPDIYTFESSFKIPEDFPYHKIPNGQDYDWRSTSYPVYFYEYEGYTVWGLTARILYQLVNIIKAV